MPTKATLLNQKYSKNSNILKYYHLKQLLSIWIYFKM